MAHLYSTAIKIKIGNIELFLFVKFRLYGTSFITQLRRVTLGPYFKQETFLTVDLSQRNP